MKEKFSYNIRKSLIKILPFIATAIMTASCHKDPTPEPEPEPEQEPYVDVIIDWVWDIESVAASKEIIKEETNKKYVRTVFINFNEMNLTSWDPASFHRARDTLQTRLDIAPGRVRGMGTVYVNSINGAHLPDVSECIKTGMATEDSLWFTANGWGVRRLNSHREK